MVDRREVGEIIAAAWTSDGTAATPSLGGVCFESLFA